MSMREFMLSDDEAESTKVDDEWILQELQTESLESKACSTTNKPAPGRYAFIQTANDTLAKMELRSRYVRNIRQLLKTARSQISRLASENEHMARRLKERDACKVKATKIIADLSSVSVHLQFSSATELKSWLALSRIDAVEWSGDPAGDHPSFLSTFACHPPVSHIPSHSTLPTTSEKLTSKDHPLSSVENVSLLTKSRGEIAKNSEYIAVLIESTTNKERGDQRDQKLRTPDMDQLVQRRKQPSKDEKPVKKILSLREEQNGNQETAGSNEGLSASTTLRREVERKETRKKEEEKRRRQDEERNRRDQRKRREGRRRGMERRLEESRQEEEGRRRLEEIKKREEEERKNKREEEGLKCEREQEERIRRRMEEEAGERKRRMEEEERVRKRDEEKKKEVEREEGEISEEEGELLISHSYPRNHKRSRRM